MPNPPQIFDTAIRSRIALPTAGTGYATPALHHARQRTAARRVGQRSSKVGTGASGTGAERRGP